MLLSAVSVLVVAQSSSEIPEGLMNNPVAVPMLYWALYFVFSGTNNCIRLYVIAVGTAWPLLDLCRKVQAGLNFFQKNIYSVVRAIKNSCTVNGLEKDIKSCAVHAQCFSSLPASVRTTAPASSKWCGHCYRGMQCGIMIPCTNWSWISFALQLPYPWQNSADLLSDIMLGWSQSRFSHNGNRIYSKLAF